MLGPAGSRGWSFRSQSPEEAANSSMLGRSRQIRYVKKKKNHISIEVRDLKKFPLTPPTYNKLKNIKTYIQHTKKQQRRDEANCWRGSHCGCHPVVDPIINGRKGFLDSPNERKSYYLNKISKIWWHSEHWQKLTIQCQWYRQS